MNAKKNILYIHGFNSDKNSTTFLTLKSHFLDFEWHTETFDLLNPSVATKQIDDIIKRKNITTIVASSLGAFYGLNIRNSLAKILINPCLIPSIELPKLGENIDVDVFEKMETDIYSNIDSELRICTLGIFGDNDELFDYSQLFTKLYGRIHRVNGGHKLDDKTLISSVQVGFDYFYILAEMLKKADEDTPLLE